MIKATRIPHAYTTERAAPMTGQRNRGQALPAPSMDCRQGTHGSCIWENCACPQNCHDGHVYVSGRWTRS